VDRDVDALARLAGQLRERGVHVSLANGIQMACERARVGGYDVMLVAKNVAEPDDGSTGVHEALRAEVPEMPPLYVLDSGDVTGEHRLPRDDVDRIVTCVRKVTVPSERSSRISLMPTSHTLDQAALGDLLVVLAVEQRSGTLTVTTPVGLGEVLMVDGHVVGATFLRFDGKKALSRMIGHRAGTAVFTPGVPVITGRIQEDTRALVDEVRALARHADNMRERVANLAKGMLAAAEGPVSDDTESDRFLLSRLRVPITLDDLLDDLPSSDAELLDAILRLHEQGRIQLLHGEHERTSLADPEPLRLLRASVERAKKLGYHGPARFVFAGTSARLAVFGRTVLSFAEALPSEETPHVPVPSTIATVRLGDGVEFEIVALPLVPAYAPLWPLALGGAAMLVRLDNAAAVALEQACSSMHVPILDARSLVVDLDESQATHVRRLIKMTLEPEIVSAS
jgi:hypothetical protein